MTQDEIATKVLAAADALIDEQARLIEAQQQAIRALSQALAVQTRAIEAFEQQVFKLRGGVDEP
jgi:hypothetical protein